MLGQLGNWHWSSSHQRTDVPDGTSQQDGLFSGVPSVVEVTWTNMVRYPTVCSRMWQLHWMALNNRLAKWLCTVQLGVSSQRHSDSPRKLA